ncbi:DNA repair protein RecN [Spiractinospora alimapuensis]|uniref:DNA repair protein RecN n=1 Tax=Spiractinospora alimapuensis TaxID=2820884 RepID=UPI001EEB656F|nr:DNA repair protein RecN [Spiractinospora alimapuensis]QVQ52114.1 DNA repair protein RecN [Spiractinospora alimapuensis]
MLEEVRIQGLGVIEDAVLELSPGLTVVTGETGAGKTMVVTGLGLLFGGRADPRRVRPGAERAVVEGRIEVSPQGRVAERVVDAGGQLDEDVVILNRSISTEGRSRAALGGRSVPVSVLGVLADDLVAVHGQSDQHRLLRTDRQREALDRYAGPSLRTVASSYASAYRRFGEVRAELEELTERAQERELEADRLRFGVNEITEADPRPGEDTELLHEENRLAHADALRLAASTAHEALAGDPAGDVEVDVMALLSTARQALGGVSEHDSALQALADRLEEVTYVVTDTATELASYTESVEADPARLAVVQERRSQLTGLARKYGETTDEMLAWAEDAAKRLEELGGDDERIESLRAELEQVHATLEELADSMTRLRGDAAHRFGADVTDELKSLAMPHASVTVRVTTGEEFGPHGRDEVEILLAPHPSAPPLPLNKGASGGELSRVMLAIEVVFAGSDPVPTFVFDEVDAGVGGKAAVEIGRRLARLAANAQVIVVTHLPQVAAFADAHLVVEKSHDGLVTESGVRSMDREGRLRELARMLAGLEDSELGRAHAEELLAVADQERTQHRDG